jgi:uncharacterized protein YukE
MKSGEVQTSAAKLETAVKTFQTTLAAVDPQWTDAARRDFQETYLAAIEPNSKKLIEVIARLAAVLSAAESQCGSGGMGE